jgi:hypothetical protein
MQQITFAQLPFLVKFSSLASLLVGWIMIEEFIIDRHHMDRFLPLYRYANLCFYDFTVIALLIGMWFYLHRKP